MGLISRKRLLKLFSKIWLPGLKPSRTEIDVVIPVIRKDLKILPLCLEGLKQSVTNKIRAIYLVSPLDEEIISFCKTHDLEFLDEKAVMGFDASALQLEIIGPGGETANRSGWLFQQLIKLSGRIGTCDNYLCIDADHILLKPHTFLSSREKPVFYMSEENHIPYYRNIRLLFPDMKLSALSYVAHKMIFNKKELTRLHNAIEEKTGKKWMEGIIENYDRKEMSGFSEFELYGNFIKEKHIRPWKQKAFSYKDISDYASLQKRLRKYASLTFPAYWN